MTHVKINMKRGTKRKKVKRYNIQCVINKQLEKQRSGEKYKPKK